MRNKKLFTLITGISVALVLALTLPLATGCTPAQPEAKVYKVCISQIAVHPDLDSNRQGIIDAMAEEGFIEGENVEYIIRSADGDIRHELSVHNIYMDIVSAGLGSFGYLFTKASEIG